MTVWLASFLFRFRYALSAVILVGSAALLPQINVAGIDNDLSMWISKDDPAYQTYERLRKEFGGQRTLLIALKSDRLFTPEGLAFVRQVTEDIKRVETVQRVNSLATATVVRSLPETGEEGGLEVRPLLDGPLDDPAEAERAMRAAVADPLFRGDLVSNDGTVTAMIVSFDEDRIDDVRGDVLARIHQIVDPRLPSGMRAFYNGSLEISETYSRITVENMINLTPPILALTVGGIFLMFRSWRVTGLLVVAILVSVVWTMGLFSMMGFTYNILASMLPPLVIILAIADDVHIVQYFNHELRETGSKEHAFKSSVQHLFVPLLGASGTTALGLLSLSTSDVVAVRSFGIGAATGVMVDFVMSLVLVPTLLMFLRPDTVTAPQERYLLGPMQRVARLSIRHARRVIVTAVLIVAVSGIGLAWLHVENNHINLFAKDHPLHESADVIDRDLSGIYNFSILFEGEPDSMKSPDTLRRMEELRSRVERLPFVRKVVSVADYVKRVNRELNGGDPAAAVIPASRDAVAQELFVFELSDDGRAELERIVASDYSRSHMSVRLASMSSDLVFEQINRAEVEAAAVFSGSGITTTATGSGRIFSTLDHYLVTSQLSSFATAFVTVFAVIFIVFRSARFGLLAIIANALPVCAVLGMMGWLGISLNVATVMVASVALGVVDDDTIHFIGRFRREAAAGASTEQAIELATMHEGRASLTTAIITSLGFGIMLLSEYKPTAWFGGLLALTMLVAFLTEVFVVPALIVLLPRLFDARKVSTLESAA